MRRLFLLLLVVAAAGYWAWPYAGAYGLARAAASHDPAAVAARVDRPALSRSLARQIVAAYLNKSGRKMGALERGLATAVGASVADPYLDQLLAPDALATLLDQGRLGQLTLGDRTVALDRTLPAFRQADLTHVLLHSYYDGVNRFRFSLPEPGGAPGDFGLHLRLDGLTWRLSGLDLPADVLDKIAADIIAAEHKNAR